MVQPACDPGCEVIIKHMLKLVIVISMWKKVHTYRSGIYILRSDAIHINTT